MKRNYAEQIRQAHSFINVEALYVSEASLPQIFQIFWKCMGALSFTPCIEETLKSLCIQDVRPTHFLCQVRQIHCRLVTKIKTPPG